MSVSRLPHRFPVGSRLIVEGDPAPGGKLRNVKRYLVLPNGKTFPLPADAYETKSAKRGRRALAEDRAGF